MLLSLPVLDDTEEAWEAEQRAELDAVKAPELLDLRSLFAKVLVSKGICTNDEDAALVARQLSDLAPTLVPAVKEKAKAAARNSLQDYLKAFAPGCPTPYSAVADCIRELEAKALSKAPGTPADEGGEEPSTALPAAIPAASVLTGKCVSTEVQIFSQAAVQQLMREAEARDDVRDKTGPYYTKLLNKGPIRALTRPAAPTALDDLFSECPNFAEPLSDLRLLLRLSFAGNGRFRPLPLLLLGDHGIGKTYFAKRLAKALGTEFKFVSLNTASAGWLLTGSSAQWNNARQGWVADALTNGSCANPLILGDELDKAAGDSRYDPLNALYSLLEPETSTMFEDEFAQVQFDASNIVWVFTANSVQSLPEPLLSRMAVYTIEKPDFVQSQSIAARLYTATRDELGLATFGSSLEHEACSKLAAMTPRLMKRALLDAFGKAVEYGRSEVCAKDIGAERTGKRAVGFC